MVWWRNQLQGQGSKRTRAFECQPGIVFEGERSGNIVRGNRTSGNFVSRIGLWGYLEGDELVEPIPYDNRISFNIAYSNGLLDLGEFAWHEEDVPTIPPGMLCQNTWRWNHFLTQVSPPDCIGVSCSVSEDDLDDLEDDRSDMN